MGAHEIRLTHCAAERVLMPAAERNEVREAVRITIYGDRFPQRALFPELIVGETPAERVSIAPDERSIRGYLFDLPPDGAQILVRYGASQEGVLEQGFQHRDIRPLPTDCGGPGDAQRG